MHSLVSFFLFIDKSLQDYENPSPVPTHSHSREEQYMARIAS